MMAGASDVRIVSLKGKNLINDLFTSGEKLKLWPVMGIVKHIPEELSIAVAYSVPKKRISRAVDRNLIKRRMREAFRQSLQDSNLQLESGFQIMFIYMEKNLSDFKTLKKSFDKLFRMLPKSNNFDIQSGKN